MLIVMHRNATELQVNEAIDAIEKLGYKGHTNPGVHRTVINVTGKVETADAQRLEGLPGVMEVILVTKPYKLADIESNPKGTSIAVGDIEIGVDRPIIIAGPCAVESREQIIGAAEAVKGMGANILRGGAFKPRTSPYSFQGLGVEGLRILEEARHQTGLPIISEALDTESFPAVETVVDIIQIGARNMQNYALLKRAGRSRKPVMLKRGMWATLTELLAAAEYIMSEGNHKVILCERGIRTHSNHTRYTLDLSSIPVLRTMTHLPLIVDPSHAAGNRDLVIPLALGGLAVGADGIMVEVHPNPQEALVDGAQSLTLDMFKELMGTIETGDILQRQFNIRQGETDDGVPVESKALHSVNT
ncbi:MAG: 3-deoxy-7-phosphoheptulonate synthase [Candidatus Lokiarchaeota archaeon]|nr:3-deoxy-7-phosphoheptulonate synthase [Candidatus Lokiarchaeota archaeon]